MSLLRTALPGLAVLTPLFLWAALRPGTPATAAPALPAPGQLAILDKKGQPGPLCPLKHTDVTADIAGFVARVNVKQEFTNPSKEPVEAIYTFPLPEDAAVDDMTMTIGDRVVRGEIKRREEARQIYEAAKSEGRAAALLDQERPNIFTQSVANVMPGARVTISISYVNLLKYDSGKYTFAFPMVVGPRYTESGGYRVPGQRGDPSRTGAQPVAEDGTPRSVTTDADKITPPITPPDTRAGHDISLAVNLDAGLPLQEVKSQLHEVVLDRPAATRATVRLRDQASIPNKDFILTYTVAGDQIQGGLLAHAERAGDGYFTLILQPPAAPPQRDISPKEMVFVIDQTGSQGGWPIEKAKETMRFCIENLNPGDTFQLLAFNTEVYPCFSRPVPVSPENVQRAQEFLKPLEGNGGTDILKAADYALRIPTDPARPRIVCYMTDGYVGNDMQIIQYIREHRGQARMFPFGVGNSVNRFLIEGMAREGRGAAEYVTLNAPGAAAASKFYDRVAKPLLLDVSVDWDGLPVADVYPKVIPDVFTAGPIILKGRYTKPGEGDLVVHGLLRGQPWSQKVHVSLPAVRAGGAAIPTLWAREKIEDLQSQDWQGAQTGSPDPKIKDRIVALALDYRLMSQYTSFVAVEQKVVNIGGKQRTIDVPVEMPEGVSYEGIFGEDRGGQQPVALFGRLPKITGSVSLSTRAARAYGYGGISGAAGYGGGQPGPAGAAGPPGPPGPPGRPALTPPPATAAPAQKLRVQAPTNGPVMAKKDALDEVTRNDSELATGSESAQKRLAAMKPEDRRAVLRQVKLAPALQTAAKNSTTAGAKSRVEVQVWLNTLPADGLAKLKALGFDLAATLKPGKLLLGTLPAAKLDALAELPFVRFIERPKFR